MNKALNTLILELQDEQHRARHLAKYCSERKDYAGVIKYEAQAAAVLFCLIKIDIHLKDYIIKEDIKLTL